MRPVTPKIGRYVPANAQYWAFWSDAQGRAPPAPRTTPASAASQTDAEVSELHPLTAAANEEDAEVRELRSLTGQICANRTNAKRWTLRPGHRPWTGDCPCETRPPGCGRGGAHRRRWHEAPAQRGPSRPGPEAIPATLTVAGFPRACATAVNRVTAVAQYRFWHSQTRDACGRRCARGRCAPPGPLGRNAIRHASGAAAECAGMGNACADRTREGCVRDPPARQAGAKSCHARHATESAHGPGRVGGHARKGPQAFCLRPRARTKAAPPVGWSRSGARVITCA